MYNKYSVKWEMLILFLDRTSLGTTSRHCRARSIPVTKVTRRGIWKHFLNALERNPRLHLREMGCEIFPSKNFHHHFAKCPSSGVSTESGEVQSLDFSRPVKPTDNAFIESFNARVRAECLNAHVFESLEDAKNILTNWRSDYNKFGSHSALGMLTPEEFAALSQRNEVPVDQNISA